MGSDGTVAPWRRWLDVDVLAAARERIAWTFDTFERIVVSFSGGKDSTCMLHLVMEEAVRRNRKVALFFVDWEAQFKLTIEHVRECFTRYSANVEPYWVCVPLRTTNACSMIEPEWVCWEPAKRDLWIREKPTGAVETLPFYTQTMTFEEFVPKFGAWYAGDVPTACFVGIRCGESLNRWRAITSEKASHSGKAWTTAVAGNAWNVYPIYDWKTEDDWTYLAKSGNPYNKLYDRMAQAGIRPHQMRICEPYGYEQRRGLWLYHIVEPETWGKVVARVAGANTGALYAGERGSILGNGVVTKPDSMTWKAYARLLLDTMPPKTAGHYENKIAVWLKWHLNHGNDVVDCSEGDMAGKDAPSWRRVVKMLLRNDYWCRALSFSPTKSDAYDKYCDLMKRRREAWGMARVAD